MIIIDTFNFERKVSSWKRFKLSSEMMQTFMTVNNHKMLNLQPTVFSIMSSRINSVKVNMGENDKQISLLVK